MKNYKDFFERVGWTFAQAFFAVLIATNITGSTQWKDVLYSALIAGGLAAAKVVVAQNVGGNNQGDLPAVNPPAAKP